MAPQTSLNEGTIRSIPDNFILAVYFGRKHSRSNPRRRKNGFKKTKQENENIAYKSLISKIRALHKEKEDLEKEQYVQARLEIYFG